MNLQPDVWIDVSGSGPPPIPNAVNLSNGITFKDWVGSGATGVVGAINFIVIPVIFALAFLVFVWGMMKYFFINGGDEGKRAEGRSFALWGILWMVVVVSVWGFVNLVLSTLGISPPA